MDRAFIPSLIWDNSPSVDLSRAAWDGLGLMPAPLRDALLGKLGRDAAQDGKKAFAALSTAVSEMSGAALDLAASDSEICNYARERADEVRGLLMAQTGATSSEGMRSVLLGYCAEFGAVPPPGVLLAGLTARMTDAAWWRRQVRRNMARKVEAHAIGLGFVHRKAGLYASDEAVKRRSEQVERNRKALENTEATNEAGYRATLAELSAVGVSNPAIRRGELMTRIAGFEGFAKQAGHVGMFYTATAPSRMHARLAKSGQENPKFDGTTPKECAGYLSKTWAKARAFLHRRKIHIYGFRVAEPHHDGTPHWHMLFFMLPEVVESVTACLRRYFCEMDAHELGHWKAAKARFESVKIDWKRGSAAGYISKYIAKNIDGKRNDLTGVGQALDNDFTNGDQYEVADSTDAAPRVLAWASCWGVRQFQQIGGPGVTVWRELRRLREMDRQGDLFDTWSAADTGNWEEFTRRQGGVECRRDARPVALWKETEEGKTNRYGEEAGAEIKGVRVGDEVTITRLHTWEIRKAGAKVDPVVLPLTLNLGASRPWSPVNNCTQAQKDADGNQIGAFGFEEPAPPLSADALARVKAAQVAAVLQGITSKRKRGAFGQFPKFDQMRAKHE